MPEPSLDHVAIGLARHLIRDGRFQAMTKGERLTLLCIALLYADADGCFVDLSRFEGDTGLSISVFQSACPTVFETGLLRTVPVTANAGTMQFDPALLP